MYGKGVQGWLKHLDFIMLDQVCLQLALMLAYAVRMGRFNFYADEDYRSIGVVLLLANFAVAFVFDSFKNVLKRGNYKEIIMTFRHALLVEAVMIIYLFSAKNSATYSRLIIYLMAALYIALSYITRMIWKKHLQRVIASSESRRSMLIVTTSDLAEDALHGILDQNYKRYRIAGFVILDQNLQGQEIAGVPVIAKAKNAADAACRVWVDEVLIYLPYYSEFPNELVGQFAEMGITVHVGLFRATEETERNQIIERLGGFTVLTTAINYATPLQSMMKRIMDILGGIVGCLVTIIFFIFLAPVIYINSPGPIFFAQERVGKNGKRFRIYKFRSMYLDAEERKKELMKYNRSQDGFMFKMENDPRIIGTKIMPDGTVKKGVGNFIRDYSIDEFPQFFNVLKGDMSLVGTRPPTVDEWEKYELHHRARLAIRPGITGLWQISGRSDITDFEEVVKLDTKYITEWSMGLDFKILFKTVAAVATKKGAS